MNDGHIKPVIISIQCETLIPKYSAYRFKGFIKKYYFLEKEKYFKEYKILPKGMDLVPFSL